MSGVNIARSQPAGSGVAAGVGRVSSRLMVYSTPGSSRLGGSVSTELVTAEREKEQMSVPTRQLQR